MNRGGASRNRTAHAAPHRAPAPSALARAAVLAVGVLAALGLASCSKKVTTVDSSFTSPEGVSSTQVGLTVWRELPNHLYIFRRGQPNADPPVPHVLVDSVTIATRFPGQLHGVIRDSTVASAYQVFRREDNGGTRQPFDYATVASRRWFDRGWEIFEFTDADSTVPTRTYQGRGLVAGAATLASPVTNEASDQVRAVENITYTGATGGQDASGNPIPLDSLFVMEWKTVPNAVAYYIHVYQWAFNLIHLEEQIASGMPAPLFIGKSHDVLVAYMPAPSPAGATVSLKMPTPDARPPEVRILTVRGTRFGQEYLVRIAAVDALGQLIAYTYGSFGQELTGQIPGGITLPSSEFAVFPLGAVKVTPTRPRTPAPLHARRGGTQRP